MASARASVLAGLRSRDPARLPVAGGDQAVARDGDLELHEGAVPRHAQEVAGHHPARLLGAYPYVELHASIAKHGEAAAGDLRVGVLHGAYDAADAGGRDGIGAGRCATVMRAGLERDVHRSAARPVTGSRQGEALCVRPATLLRPAARDDLARRLVGDDGTDSRVGRRAAQHAMGHP
jgi:hypothetical protein